jgi:glycosyltransferase involved in cell wall biosynthesis
MEPQQRRVLVAVPSTTDVVGAGGVAPRWANYVNELRRSGWVVDVWTVDAQDEEQRIPRVVHPFFPRTLTDAPSSLWTMRLWRRLRSEQRPRCVVVTDLFNDVNIALLCRAARVPLLYSIHTDGSKLPGGVPSLASASQACTAYLSAACATTSPSFARILADRGVIRAAKNVWTYRPPTSSDLRIDLSTEEIAQERRRLTNGHGATVLLLYAGRWSAEKRIGLLVRCVRQLPDVSLALIGDAADESIAREIQQWHDPRNGVHVVRGMRRRGRELACSYAAADFLASASDFETFGNTCAEAAAVGTPALVQRGPGFIDQVSASPRWSSLSREDSKEEDSPALYCSDRGALLDYASKDAAALVQTAVRALEPLRRDPERVRRAALDAERQGATISELVETISCDDGRRPSYILLLLALFVGCVLRLFVEVFALYLRGLSNIVKCSSGRLMSWLRPPARRVRWAGSLVGRGCIVFRQNLASIRRFDLAEVDPLPINLVPENPFEDYVECDVVKLEGLRETAATLAMPRASAARFRRRLSENS